MSITEAYMGLVNSPNFSDVSILTKGDRKLHAHKVILHARCSTLLHMAQNFEGACVIDLSQYQEDTIISILKYIYAGHGDVSPWMVSEVLRTSAVPKLEVKDAFKEEDALVSDTVCDSQGSKLTSALCGPAHAQVETSSVADSSNVSLDRNVHFDVGDMIGKKNIDAPDSCLSAPSNVNRQEQNDKKSSETVKYQNPIVTTVAIIKHEPHPNGDPYSCRFEEVIIPDAQPNVCCNEDLKYESPDQLANNSTNKRCLDDITAKPIEDSKILDLKIEDSHSPVKNNDFSSDILDPKIIECLEKLVNGVVENYNDLDLFKADTNKPSPLHINDNNKHLASSLISIDNTSNSKTLSIAKASNISSEDDTKASNVLGYQKSLLSSANNGAGKNKPLKRKKTLITEIPSLKPSIYQTKGESQTDNSLLPHNASQTSPTAQDLNVPKNQISKTWADTHVDISKSSTFITSPQKPQIRTRRGLAKKNSPILLSFTLNDTSNLSQSASPIPSCSSCDVSVRSVHSDHQQVESRLNISADCLLTANTSTEHEMPKNSIVPVQSSAKILSPDMLHIMSQNLTKITSNLRRLRR